MKIDLSGRIALVTGGSGELGKVISRTLGECGADVIIHYNRNGEKASELCEEIKGMGRRAIIVQADITNEASIYAMRDFIVKEIGAPDIIVNNAVIQYTWESVLNQSLKDYESQFNSCVIHNVLMAKAFVPFMIEKNWGRVIGINTECSMQNFPNQSAYVAGKRGMDGVLRVLAKEVGEHAVTVNQVAPGWVITEGERERGISQSEAYNNNVPLKRRGNDIDIANAVAFLASDLASFISGAYLPVCGGNVMPAI